MHRLRRNLIANFVGAGWLALSGLIFAPIYIRLLGIESYGLISFYYLLQAALQVFDFGLSPTINREMARYSVQPERSAEARDFVRTFEVGYWGLGLALGVLVWAAAPFIATRWLKVDVLSVEAVQFSVTSMAVLIVLQWPLTLYEGGLLGLQRQVLFNSLLVTMTTLRTVGVVFFFWAVAPSIVNFFLWQIIVSVAHVVLITVLFWRSLPPAHRTPRIDLRLVQRVWHFAAGMMGSTLSWFVLSQSDKIILSSVVSLALFGFYALASAIANSLSILVAGPVFNATFPRFSTLIALGDREQTRLFYHFSSQLIAVLVFPLGAVLAGFSYEIVLLWIGNPVTARAVAPIAGILIVGTILSVLKSIPYAVQLAHGWPAIGLRINVGSLVWYIPTMLVLINQFGAIGAATGWVALNATQLLLVLFATHQRVLKGEVGRWIWADNILPLLGPILVVLLGKRLVNGITSPWVIIIALIGVMAVALAVSVASAHQVRKWVWLQIAGQRRIAPV
jgi:O-antigen/teichoic acid export membrane protein